MSASKKLDSIHSFTTRIHTLFTAIFAYHFTRKPVIWERETMFGTYTSLMFRKASESPLLQLIAEESIGEFKTVEILVKNKTNQRVDDTDLESVIMNVRDQENTLFILVTSGEVPMDDFQRLYRVFTRHLVVILPLGESDIARLEKLVKTNNINACLVILATLADRITSEGEKLYGSYETFATRQKEATLKRLHSLGTLKGPQLRTLIKKLSFLMSFERSGGEITKACRAINISRKLFYLWCDNDPVFKKLLHLE